MKDKETPLISVVMLNYNGLKYLKQTIKPILNQDYPNSEFIIVDNGSTDGSIEYIKKINEIRLIENGENLGYSKGKNIGVKKAKGKYVLLLDNDILIKDNDILNRLYNSYSKLQNPAFMNVVLIDLEDIEKKITKQYGSYYGIFGIKENKYTKLKKITHLFETVISFGGAMFIKRNIFKQLGYLDESQPFNLDDDDISLRAKVYGYKNYTYTKNFFVHLGNERRANNKIYRWKYKYYFSGKGKPIIKNFQIKTIIIIFPFFVLKTIIKTFKQVLFRLDIRLFYSLFYSIALFHKDLKNTLSKRRIIQKNRKVKDKSFLKIRPPKFD